MKFNVIHLHFFTTQHLHVVALTQMEEALVALYQCVQTLLTFNKPWTITTLAGKICVIELTNTFTLTKTPTSDVGGCAEPCMRKDRLFK